MKNSFRHFFLFCLGMLAAACAITNFPTIQPQVQNLLLYRKYDQAVALLDQRKKEYGSGNELLYFYDRAMVLHLAGRYAESAAVFEKAKRRYDDLYTKSISRIGASWLVNDYTLPYRGEDFERVMVNVFQSLNYAQQGDIGGALVEVRDAITVLTTINLNYGSAEHLYRDDAFARLLMGAFFEAGGSVMDTNDAYISYQKALALYENDYKKNYGFLSVPRILKENLFHSSKGMGPPESAKWSAKLGLLPSAQLDKNADQAQVYLIIYHGFSPQKVQDRFFVPTPDGHLLKIAFPKYEPRIYNPLTGEFCGQGVSSRVCTTPELAEDLSAIATKTLADRKLRTLAKAALRPLGKYALAKGAEYALKKKEQHSAAIGVQYASVAYGLMSEQADLRSWQTLPAQIWIARIFVPPGEQELIFNGQTFARAVLKAEEIKFLTLRTW